jgi:tetratricopeptide (TPR) repeat protein
MCFALATSARADEATVRVEKVTIPTFELGPNDPAPNIFEMQDTDRAYPRSAYNIASRSEDSVDKQYEMAVLENDLVRVEVLPEVGGHIWRIIDKKTGKNLLWTNDAVKPVRVGRRHGWIAGGIEFPFPVGNHGEDALEPYRWSIRDNADGSATATVSSFDHFYHFWGSYDITLRPDDARVAVTVRLYNPTTVRNRYQLWVNAAVKVGDDMQYIFPTEFVTGHGFGGVFPWPSMDKDTDRSYWKNVRESLGVFAWHADYLGAYYHNDDYGIIRYSPKSLTEGIKLWTWGTRSGWTTEYSLNQGPYGEIQGGRWPTQTMYGWLEPRQMDTWTEYWYPVKGLGGIDQASRYAAMKVSVERDGEKPKSAEIRINALVPVKGRLVVASGDSTLATENVEIAPGELIVTRADISTVPADGAFNVSVIDSANLSLISHDVRLKAEPSPTPEAPADVRLESTGPGWDALARGLARELNEDDLASAGESYESATRDYPDFAPGWKALGILRYKQADYEPAIAALEKAASIAPDDLEARYYIGLTQLAMGRPDYAATLAAVSGDAKFAHAAKYVLARETAAAGDYAGAQKAFAAAGNGWSCDAALWAALAVSARKAGDAAAAGEALEAALAAEPLNAFAMVEALFAAGKAAPEAVRETLGRDSDLYVETALFYGGLGCAAEALEVAKAGEPLADSGLYFYYLSSFAGMAGDAAAALEYAKKAEAMGTDYVFPNRREALAVLDAAAALTGNAGFPEYHKGVWLYWMGRHETAGSLWESLIGKYNVPGLYRNVARAYTVGRFARIQASAIELYTKALEEDPDDPELYHALDDLYIQSHDQQARRRLLEDGRAKLPEDDMLALRTVNLLVERRRFAEARDILESRKWRRAHQSMDLMRLGTSAITGTYNGLAMEAIRGGDDDKALEYLKKSADARQTLQQWFD